MAYDFEGAIKAGYTAPEINQYLSQKHGYDYQGALDSGISDQDILVHLGAKEGADLMPQPAVNYDRGLFMDTVSHAARGVAEAGSQVAGAMRLADADVTQDTGVIAKAGGALQRGIDYAKQNYDILKPDVAEVQGEGLVKRDAMVAVESSPASLLPIAGGYAGAIAGATLGSVVPVVGTATGAIVGGIIGYGATLFGTFGLGQYQNTYDETKKQLAQKGVVGEEAEVKAKDNALTTGAAEVIGEFFGDLAAVATFGGSKLFFGQTLKAVIKETMAGSAKDLFKTGAKQFGKEVLIDAPFEIGSEMGTAYVKAKKAQELGLSEQTTQEAMGAAVLPAAFMSLIFGGSIHGMEALKAKSLLANLNSNDQQARVNAAVEVAGRIRQNTGDDYIAQSWLGGVRPLLESGAEIPINAPIADYATQNIGQEIEYHQRVEAPRTPRQVLAGEQPTEAPKGPLSKAVATIQPEQAPLQAQETGPDYINDEEAARFHEQALQYLQGQNTVATRAEAARSQAEWDQQAQKAEAYNKGQNDPRNAEIDRLMAGEQPKPKAWIDMNQQERFDLATEVGFKKMAATNLSKKNLEYISPGSRKKLVEFMTQRGKPAVQEAIRPPGQPEAQEAGQPPPWDSLTGGERLAMAKSAGFGDNIAKVLAKQPFARISLETKQRLFSAQPQAPTQQSPPGLSAPPEQATQMPTTDNRGELIAPSAGPFSVSTLENNGKVEPVASHEQAATPVVSTERPVGEPQAPVPLAEKRYFSMNNGRVNVTVVPKFKVGGRVQQNFEVNGRLVIGMNELKAQYPEVYDRTTSNYPDLLSTSGQESKISPASISTLDNTGGTNKTAESEPWQMTRKGFQVQEKDKGVTPLRSGQQHLASVATALGEGKPVPQEIVDHYGLEKLQARPQYRAAKEGGTTPTGKTSEQAWNGMYPNERYDLAKQAGFTDVRADQMSKYQYKKLSRWGDLGKLDKALSETKRPTTETKEPPPETQTPVVSTETPVGEAQAREPWQMTLGEYEAVHGKPRKGATSYSGNTQHRNAVATAVNQGKPVPPEVLAGYPDLSKKEGKTTTSGEPVQENDMSAEATAELIRQDAESRREGSEGSTEVATRRNGAYRIKSLDGDIEYVSGEPVAIDGLPEVSFFVHKTKGGYTISEETTGLNVISPSRSKREAIADAKKEVQRLGAERVKQSIADAPKLNEPKFSRENKRPWPADFPNATLHTTMSKLQGHPDYKAAKAGDVEAAIRLVDDLANFDKIKALKEAHPDAIVVTPHAIEAAGKNAIPRVFAEAFEGAGFAVDTSIVQINEPHRTSKDSPLRLALRPEFEGQVKPGREYIMLDDAIGQGGTMAELRHFIESRGGKVVNASALTSGIFGAKLSIRPDTITKLQEKFGRAKLESFLKEFNTAGSIDALTEKEGRFILRQLSLDAIRDRILADAREANISPSAWQVQASFSRLANTPSFTSQSTAAEVKQRLFKSLTIRGVNDLTKSGKLKIVQTEAELRQAIGETGDVRADAQNRTLGVYHNGTAYLVADHLNADNTHGVLLHEMVHAELDQNGWKGLLGNNYEGIKAQVERMVAEGHEGLVAAQEKARQAGTPAGDLFEETVTHFIQDRASQSTGLFRRILRVVRAWAIRVGLRRTITADDLVGLAEASLKRGVENANGETGKNAASFAKQSGTTGEDIGKRIAAEQKEFGRQLDEFANRTGDSGRLVKIGSTPDVLMKLGAKQLPLTVTRKVLAKVWARGKEMYPEFPDSGKHSLSMDQLQQLPRLLSDPVMVLDSHHANGSMVVLVELRDNRNRPVMAAITLDKMNARNQINAIASVHGRGEEWFVEQVEGGRLRYWNKKKSLDLLQSAALQLRLEEAVKAFSGAAKLPSDNRILTEDDLVKGKGARNALYSKAVNRIEQQGLNLGTEEDFHTALAGQTQAAMNATPGETEVNDIIGRAIKAGRPIGLGGLTLRQITDIYGDRIPELKDFYNTARALGAETNKRMATADGLLSRWRELPQKQADAMASIMYEATLHAVNPDVQDFEPRVDVEATLAKVDDRKAEIVNLQKDMLTAIGADRDYLEKKMAGLEEANRTSLARIEREKERGKVFRKIRREYKDLDKATKQVYQDVKAHYEQNFTDLKEALLNRMDRTIKDKAAKKMAMDKIRVMFEKQISEGPYFPLARFGKFVVVATKGTDRIVSSFESVKEQEATAARLKAQGYEVKMKVKSENSQETEGTSSKFVSGVVNLINDAAVEPSEKAALLDDVNQLLIRTMPDLSHRKHFIHRKKVAGFSRDAVRSFASNTQHAAHHIARINHADKMAAAIESIRGKIDLEKAGDTTVAGQVNNELVKRMKQINNPDISPFAQALCSAGFLWHIGPSIASSLVNLTQTPLVAYPILAARSGDFVASGNALRKATFDFMRSTWTANGPSLLKGDRASSNEKDMIKRLIDDGTIDVTQAHELAQAASSNFMNAAQTAWGTQVAKVMRAVSYPFHVTEIANRKITALAAYRESLRMARDKGEDATSEAAHERAVAFARDVVMDGHFDYCVDRETECLTENGWKRYDALEVGEKLYAVDGSGNAIETELKNVHVFNQGDHKVVEFSNKNGFSMVLTPNHDNITQTYSSRDKKWYPVKKVKTKDLRDHHFVLRVPLVGITEETKIEKYTDDEVRLIAWIACDGWYSKYRNCINKNDVRIGQSETSKSGNPQQLRELLANFGEIKEYTYARTNENCKDTFTTFVLPRAVGKIVQDAMPDKTLSFGLINDLSLRQKKLLFDLFLAIDGNTSKGSGRVVVQKAEINLHVLQAIATMLGISSSIYQSGKYKALHIMTETKRSHIKALSQQEKTVDLVWCPETTHGTWIARRNGRVFVTGNSQINRARYMEGNWQRCLLLFRQYSQNMWYLMGRSFYQATKGESAEVKTQARKQLLGILGGHFMLSGVMGMPVIGAVADMVQFLLNGMGDGDDPYDWETWLRNAAADTFGVEGGEMLTKGPVRALLPWDVSGRASLSDLIYRKPTKETEGRDWFTQKLEMAAGPLAGLGSNLVAGAFAMAEGQVWRGVEMMLPKALKDAMKSVRYYREGLTSWDNEQVLAEISAMETFGQLLGFSPATVAEMYEARSAIKDRERDLNKRRQWLVNEWVNATQKGSMPRANKVMADIAAFNETNPVFKVEQSTLRQSLRVHERSVKNTRDGVYLPATKDELRNIGRFANLGQTAP